ncbi:MAG: hypothetical protein WDO73_16930 [Ignavibacteriota bacterium]
MFGSRLLLAMGYLAQPTYFVGSGTVSGVHGLKRAKPFVHKDGSSPMPASNLHEGKKALRVEDKDWT